MRGSGRSTIRSYSASKKQTRRGYRGSDVKMRCVGVEAGRGWGPSLKRLSVFLGLFLARVVSSPTEGRPFPFGLIGIFVQHFNLDSADA